jgi:hypothetical protein
MKNEHNLECPVNWENIPIEFNYITLEHVTDYDFGISCIFIQQHKKRPILSIENKVVSWDSQDGESVNSIHKNIERSKYESLCNHINGSSDEYGIDFSECIWRRPKIAHDAG